MGPNFEQASHNFKAKVRFAKVNTEDQQSLGAHFNIRSIPTLILFKHAKEVDRISGVVEANDLINWLKARV
jgi:thioredoxin 2